MLSDSIRVCVCAEVADAAFLVRFDMVAGLFLDMVLGMVVGVFCGLFLGLLWACFGIALGLLWALLLGVAVGASRDRYGQSS